MSFILTIVIYAGSLMVSTTTVSGLTEKACHDHGAAVVAKANAQSRQGSNFYICTAARQ